MSTRGQGQCLTFVQGHSDLYFQTASAANPLCPVEARFHVELLWIESTKICSDMTKMATMPIYGKNPLKIFFSRTSGPISLKLGIQYRGHGPCKVCSNDDPGSTITYFMARSALLPNAFVWENA